MEVKKAIECIKDKYEDSWNEGNCRVGQGELMREQNEIISLLQEGEKYKAIIEELLVFLNSPEIVTSQNIKYIIDKLKLLKQKYFPPVKKVITIEVEGKDIDWGKLINNIKRNIEKEIWLDNRMVKVNIKEG